MMLYLLGILNLLKTIVIILLIYYGFKLFVRFFGPYLIKKAVDKAQKNAQQNYANPNETTVEEGKTVIDKKPKSKSKNTNQSYPSDDEYIDFEEIE